MFAQPKRHGLVKRLFDVGRYDRYDIAIFVNSLFISSETTAAIFSCFGALHLQALSMSCLVTTESSSPRNFGNDRGFWVRVLEV